MRKYLRSLFCLIFTGILTTNSYATLQLELTQGVSRALPIAIVPFAGQAQTNFNDPSNIAAVVAADLNNSGQFNVLPFDKIAQLPSKLASVDFNYWRSMSVNDMVIGQVESEGGNRYRVSFSLLDIYQGLHYQDASKVNPVLVSDSFVANKSQLRSIAHHISDVVYQQLTGKRGIFSTKIAYVLVEKKNDKYIYRLAIADVDGYNPRYILVSNEPIMSPSWSPDGHKIAYVSFENQHAAIYIQNIASGHRFTVSDFPGMNQAPAWSPDGKKLALVLSKTGVSKIYLMNLQTKQLEQLTDGYAIDTEPRFTPDGKSIVFTSDRGGAPQIYQLSLANRQINRLTYAGSYNATATVTPDGQSIVFLHKSGNQYNIAIQPLGSSYLSQLTNEEDTSSPSVAPNGQMVIYSSNIGDRGILSIVSIDGKIHIQLPSQEGSVREPAWSPV